MWQKVRALLNYWLIILCNLHAYYHNDGGECECPRVSYPNAANSS